jgi:hypothetical protein
MYTMMSNILLSRLTQNAEEIIGDSDHISAFNCFRKIGIRCNSTLAIHRFKKKKTYVSDTMEVLYTITIEFGIPLKLVRLSKFV